MRVCSLLHASRQTLVRQTQCRKTLCRHAHGAAPRAAGRCEGGSSARAGASESHSSAAHAAHDPHHHCTRDVARSCCSRGQDCALVPVLCTYVQSRGPQLESAHHVKACRWSTAARSVTLEAIAALAVNCVCVRSPVPLVVAIGVAHSEARNHELANNGNWAALAVLEHAYAAAAGRRNLDAHALWRAEAAVAMPGACNLFRREQLRSLLSVAHGGGGALSWTSSRGGAYHGS